MVKKVISVLCLASFLAASSVFAEALPIGNLFKSQIKDKVPVKVYISDVVNTQAGSPITIDIFRAALEKSLNQRRSIKFQTVKTAAESDIQVSADVKYYQYLVRGPLKPSPGIETTLLDAAATMTENYVEMCVIYKVSDTKTNKLLWESGVNEYIKKNMTPEESIPLILDVVTRTFVWRCFGKATLRDSNSLAM